MNLNAVASRSTRFVTPPVTAWLQVSTGWTQNPDYSRSPSYATFPVLVDIQALSSSQIEHMDALNIQGVLRVAYFSGIIEGLNRPAGKGGDTLTFKSGSQNGTTWPGGRWRGEPLHLRRVRQRRREGDTVGDAVDRGR